jgi:SAM-dependent methyltransferase
MWLDAVDLRDFYASGLGQAARRLIGRRLRLMWPDVRGCRVLGVGYATPFLRPFRAEAERVVATMPATQGAIAWPPDGGGLVALTEDVILPFPDRAFDRILLVHALENTGHARALMREAWRVLTDGGRMIVVVPNRQGVWARLERTPFALGRPYSAQQLHSLLRDTMFAPLTTGRALFLPPLRKRLFLPWSGAVERFGIRWFPGISGVVLVEAGKQIYAAPGDGARAGARAYLSLSRSMRLGPSGRGARQVNRTRREDAPG